MEHWKKTEECVELMMISCWSKCQIDCVWCVLYESTKTGALEIRGLYSIHRPTPTHCEKTYPLLQLPLSVSESLGIWRYLTCSGGNEWWNSALVIPLGKGYVHTSTIDYPRWQSGGGQPLCLTRGVRAAMDALTCPFPLI